MITNALEISIPKALKESIYAFLFASYLWAMESLPYLYGDHSTFEEYTIQFYSEFVILFMKLN